MHTSSLKVLNSNNIDQFLTVWPAWLMNLHNANEAGWCRWTWMMPLYLDDAIVPVWCRWTWMMSMNLDDVVEPGWWWWSSSRSQDSLHILKECGTCQAEIIHLKQKPLCNQGINCTSHYTGLLGITFTSVFKTALSCTWLSTCSACTCSVLREPIPFSMLFQSIKWLFQSVYSSGTLVLFLLFETVLHCFVSQQ